jgi:hypothetical protein
VVGPIFSGADGGSIAVEEPSCEIPPGSIVGGGSDASVGGNFALALAPTVVQDGTVSVFYSSSVRSVTGFEFTLLTEVSTQELNVGRALCHAIAAPC